MSVTLNLSAGAGRLTPMSSPFSVSHFDDLHEFVQVHVAAGYLPVAAIVDEAVEIFSDLVIDPARQQLAIGGHLVVPVGGASLQSLLCVARTGDDAWTERDLGKVRFVPLIAALDR